MSINIKGAFSKPSQTGSSKASSAGKSSKGKGASATTTSSKSTDDSVELTDTASKLQQIEQSLSDIPIIDSGRVEAVSQSIEDGQYQIDNEKIADRIIKNETDINNLKKQP